MTDLEITKLCAEAVGVSVHEYQDGSLYHFGGLCEGGIEDYDPLQDDAQAMALGKKFPEIFSRAVQEWVWRLDHGETGFDLNYHFCDRVAKMQSAKEPA